MINLDLCFAYYDEKLDKLTSKQHIFIKNVRDNISDSEIKSLGELLVKHVDFNVKNSDLKIRFLYSKLARKGEERSLF